MSVGGPSNLGTLLIRRLDTALSVPASQQSQIVDAGRSDAITQLADASRINPLHNEGGRSLSETIERAQAQAERPGRQPVEETRLRTGLPLPRFEQPSTETSSTPSAPTTLGHAAKAILALLARFPGQAPPVAGRAPLAQPEPAATGTAQAAAAQPSSGVPAALIARSLALAVQQSGLFYESHLGDLAFGGRSPAQLRLEPQGQIRGSGAAAAQGDPASAAEDRAPARAAAQAAEGSSALRDPAAHNPVERGPTERGPTERGPTEGRGPGAMASAQSGSAQAGTPLAGLHPETHLVVRQQLETLANQAFGWRGEAWPDAPMQWEVERRDERGVPDEAGTHWATRLRLSLPALGEVEARLSLHAGQVVMRLVAPHSAPLLKQHGQALRADFLQAGLTLSQLSILEAEETKETKEAGET